MGNMTPEMEAHFEERTKLHIGLVDRFYGILLKGLNMGGLPESLDHDSDKYSPRLRGPYVFISWKYKCQRDGAPCDFSEKDLKEMGVASYEHVRANPHHPEFHDPKSELNLSDKDKPSRRVCDAEAMPDPSIVEMVADWAAVGYERDGSSPRKWADDNVGKRWRFSKGQTGLIYRCIGILERDFDFGKHPEQLTEASSPSRPSRISKARKLISDVMSILDTSGINAKKYKEMFDGMSEAQAWSFLSRIAKDENEFVYLEVVPFKNEPTLREVKAAADFLGVPLEEYVYFRHIQDGKVIRTRTKCPVGFLPIKRVQQMLSKKNSYNLKVDARSAKTGQLNAEGKVAKISDMENYSLTAIGADSALREFLGPRADDFGAKQQLYQRISQEGYAYLKDLSSEIEDKKTLNTVDVYLLGGGLKSDLVTQGLELMRTLKSKKGTKKSSSQRLERK